MENETIEYQVLPEGYSQGIYAPSLKAARKAALNYLVPVKIQSRRIMPWNDVEEEE